MAMVKADLISTLETFFGEDKTRSEAAQELGKIIDAYIRTATVTTTVTGTITGASATGGPVTGTCSGSGTGSLS